MRDGNLPMSSPPEAGQERDRETMDQEKRLRREIANSNERRRMQSINAGFQSLRNLLPHHEGEKLSKVSAPDLLTPSILHLTRSCFSSHKKK